MSKKFRFLLPVILVLTSCNQLFYQPDSVIYQSPGSLEKSEIETIWISSKNNKIHGWHIKSKLRESLGTIIHFHGNAQNLSAHIWFSHWMTNYGFDLIIFDYSGYGFSTGNPNQNQLVRDGFNVVKWSVQSTKIIKPIFILGQSLGGRIAITSLNQIGTQFDISGNIGGIILDSTFNSYRDLARMKLSEFWLTWPLQYPLSWLVSDEYDPNLMTQKISEVPLLAFHSNHDPVVPINAGMDLYKQFTGSANIEIMQESGHTLALTENPQFKQNRKQIVNFLCQHARNFEGCKKLTNSRSE